eukprot:TRINITY_DN528_c0_g2_i4.p1 TRINITY_DN528_c0_g2~~TRINITY_DN528_c0_g2_i4.p1  ORF type:complete len:194 (+),score=60.82 TRINITY_DN528_c0_g2_i4:86-667(+)
MGCYVCVPTKQVAIVERFGKFQKLAEPGCTCLNPILGESVAGELSLRILQFICTVETKTFDNVFVEISVATQYQVLEDHVYEAFYKLSNHEQQIKAYIFDVVRSSVPTIDLDAVFETKDEIAETIKEELEKSMTEYGFEIIDTLIIDIKPAAKVKKSMNEINAAQRLRVAANDKAESEKILVVKAAEAEAESK